MKNIALHMMTAFILSMLAGYLFPFILGASQFTLNFNSEKITDNQKTMIIKYNENSFVAPVISNFSACSYINMCMLAEPLQSILKTTVQKGQYLYVLRKLDEYELPHELALIPIIESQYNAYALSSKGAAGLWQLMPKTAKDYGLLDQERFELESSTNAALLFLKKLHDQFGSWELAIAAYNAGSKRVQNALIQNPSAKTIQELSLPTATKKYVSSFNKMMANLH